MVDVERLNEIKEEIKELLSEAHGIVRCSEDYMALRRAESYWYAHIRIALDDESEFVGRSMVSMQSTIDELTVENDEYELEEACPGCGCEPGDGLTDDCEHPDGCGFGRRMHCDGDIEGGRARWH
jgi:hypothetical protein